MLATQTLCRGVFRRDQINFFTVCFFFLALIHIPLYANDEEEVFAHTTITWRISNSNFENIKLEISKFYLDMYQNNFLRWRPLHNDNGLTVSELLEREILTIGGTTLAIEKILCERNSGLCSLGLLNSNKCETAIAPTFSESNCTKFVVKAGDIVEVPDVIITRETDVKLFDVRNGDTVESRVLAVRGCRNFGSQCKKAIKTVNSRKLPDINLDSYQGQLYLPYLTAEIEFSAPTERGAIGFGDEKQVEKKIKDIHIEGHGAVVDAIKSSLPANLDWFGSYDAEPLFASQKSLFDLAAHPTNELMDSAKRPREVWIFDGWVDRKHCEFENVANLDISILPRSQKEFERDQRKCGTEYSGSVHVAQHHGSHVTGLIAAPFNKKGIAGFNPHALVKSFEVLTADKKIQRTTREYIGRVLKDSQKSGVEPAVVNFSFGFSYPDPDIRVNGMNLHSEFDSALRDIDALYVAAAGQAENKGEQGKALMSGYCNIVPACYTQLPNLITVVGLKNSPEPELMVESNYHKNFHIGATAESVLSTGAYSTTLNLWGSSQAAPQVAAAALFLFSQEKKMYAEEVKNRLIYTSDLSPELEKKIFGGRLNIARAINESTECDYVEFNYEEGYYAAIQFQVFKAFDQDGVGTDFSIENLRRLKRHPSTNMFSIYAMKEGESSDMGDLKKYTNMIHWNETTPVLVTKCIGGSIDVSGPAKTRRFGEITDFIARRRSRG